MDSAKPLLLWVQALISLFSGIFLLVIARKQNENNKTLDQLSLGDIKKIYKGLDKNVLKIFNVKNSMNAKKSYGGTASNNVAMMIKKYKKEIK